MGLTVADTFASSYLNGATHTPGWAAEAAANRKCLKYAELAEAYHFVPIAFETMGALCSAENDLISAIGSRITSSSGDPRETSFLRQRLSVAIQRGNAASILSSFKHFFYSDHR